MSDLIDRQAAIEALKAYAEKYNTYPIAVYDAVGVLQRVPPAQPHTYRGVTLNDVMMYFDSLEGNEDAWTEFCSCFECRGWGLYPIRSATDKNVGTNEDCISRQAAITQLSHNKNKGDDEWELAVDNDIQTIWKLPPVTPKQPNLSEAYANAVFTWLMSYQIQSAQLKGRYTPYEVIGWVLNDWRKEHDAERDT